VPSVLLFTDQERYLFNAPEGAQRVLRECKARLSRVGHVFATRAAPSAIGGLPGLLLSSAAPTAPGGGGGGDGAAASAAAGLIEQPVAAHLYGPPGMRSYVDAFRLYAAPPHGALRVHEVSAAAAVEAAGGPGAAAAALAAPIYSSGVVAITPVLLQAVEGGGSDDDPEEIAEEAAEAEEERRRQQERAASRKRPATAAGEEAGGGGDQQQQQQRDADPVAAAGSDDQQQENGKRPKTAGGDHPDALGARAGGVRRSGGGGGGGGGGNGAAAAAIAPPACAWVCRLADLPGKFDPSKAAAAGVPRGPLWGDLQRGRTVLSASGAAVAPADVMSPPSAPGPLLVVVDCPSPSHARALLSSPELVRAARDSGGPPGGGGGESAPAASAPPRAVVVVHLSPAGVQRSLPYRRWLRGFGAGARHLSLPAGDARPPAGRRALELQARLHAVEPLLFPLEPLARGEGEPGRAEAARAAAAAAHGRAVAAAEAEAAAADEAGGAPPQPSPPVVVPCGHLHRYTLAPARAQGLELDDAPTGFDVAGEAAGLLAKHASVAAAVSAARAEKTALAAAAATEAHPGLPAWLAAGDRSQGALTLLGTCSAVPTHFRNVSSYLLETGGGCGGGEEPAAAAAEAAEGDGVGLPPAPPPMRAGLLLDCGEDCVGQMERVFGREGAAERVRRLAAVWVSHMHADHHGALYGILERRAQEAAAAAAAAARANGQEGDGGGGAPAGGGGSSAPPPLPPLLIIGPWPLFRVLTTYVAAMPHLRDSFLFLPSPYLAARYAEHQQQQQQSGGGGGGGGDGGGQGAAPAAAPGRPPPPPHILAAYERAKASLGLSELWAFHVEHVANSFGLRVAAEAAAAAANGGGGGGGWALVSSGDTRPCADVARAARGATLLLHEATFDDELAHEALAKRHSTVGEALGVARQAGAYRTLLTHFSTRYPRLPPPRSAAAVTVAGGAGASAGGAAAAGAAPAFALAFDLMTINLADLPSLPAVVAPLDAMFRAAYEGDALAAED